MRAALIHASSGKIQNVIELPDDYDRDAEGAYKPPPGHRVEPDPEAQAVIDGHFRDGAWEAHEQPEPPAEPIVPAEVQVEALRTLLLESGASEDDIEAALASPAPPEQTEGDG